MAALLRHGIFKIARLPSTKNVRSYATKAEKKKDYDKRRPPTIYSSAESIAAKGFLRPQNSYQPPKDAHIKLDAIFKKLAPGIQNNTPISNLQEKFNLLAACAKEFSHSIPNSLLYKTQTLDEIRNFYLTPVETTTPLDKMRNMELPKNLHIQFEYHRFHPDTDTKFGGQTAFNRSSTIVTGLKYKDKYKGHVQNETWPFSS